MRLCCLLAALLCCVSLASAQGTYQALCAQAGLTDPDVIGWLEIPGADWSMPVMRRAGDDAFYAKHDAHGREAAHGALYVQANYNAADFSDPVTLVYGASTDASAPFARLQEMYSGSFEAYRTLLVHTPQGTKEYAAFAAVPYPSVHILHYYNFSSERRYNSFFDDVYAVRALGMHLVQADRPEAGQDQVLILSTGVRGDSSQRYLVMAKLITPAE